MNLKRLIQAAFFGVLTTAYAVFSNAPAQAAPPANLPPTAETTKQAAAPLAQLPASAPATPESAKAPEKALAKPAEKTAGMTMSGFLDRLMMAESGGRADARNPRSTAVGPYQFIESTWLDLARRLFPAETVALTPVQILALRSDHSFARRGAEAYTKDNAAALKANGIEPTFPHLRLAFLLGPQGAIRVLQAAPETRVTAIVGPAVANANPFMYGLTAEGLINRAARDLAVPASTLAGIAPGDIPNAVPGKAASPRPPRVTVRCNLDLPACRRWQSLALARLPAIKNKLASARAR